MRYLIGLVLGCGIVALPAQAQEVRGAFVGASIGWFNYEEVSQGLRISDSTSSYRILGGYQFNSVYAIEAGWGVTGDFKERFDALNASLEIKGDVEIATLRFLAMAPFSNMSMFGGVGYFDARRNLSFRLQSPVEIVTGSVRFDDSGLTVAGGVQYEFERFALRGEYEWFDMDGDVEASNFGVSALFRF